MRKLFLLISFFLFSSALYSFDVDVVDMVGRVAGSTSTVALPASVKASSDWVPLFRIDISTNLVGYTLTS
ncbi:MAG TPA: hypothetical protein VJC03_04810, partial [bacterium]|nr:hypothetical protein [bacterium]